MKITKKLIKEFENIQKIKGTYCAIDGLLWGIAKEIMQQGNEDIQIRAYYPSNKKVYVGRK